MTTWARRALLAAGVLLAVSACGTGAAASATPSAVGSATPAVVSPVDSYLNAVHAETGKEAAALEAGYLACSVAYLGEEVESITIQTRYDGPHLWFPNGLESYEAAAKTYLCPPQ